MSFEKIVTHPGSAHKDEFLACSILIAEQPVPIFRQEPTEDDLENRAVCVVDVGNRHEPEKHNFDHHQFPADQTPTCSLSLVLQYLGLYEDAAKIFDWLEAMEWFDCRGPAATAAWLGIEREAMSKLNSPLDITLLRRFAKESQLQAGDPIWEVMRMIGSDLLEFVRSLQLRLEFIADHSELWEFENFNALFLPRTEPLPEDPGAGLGLYLKNRGLDNNVAALVYPDRRGSGYGLTRFNEDMRLDFTRVEQEPDVHFVHRQGFVAKSTALDPRRLRELMSKAWRG
ncbi:MAG TPA: MYG1 family protein [Opitutales bacterium]|nr:MYG1 family protein [Opitutales bacterium]